MPDVNFVLNQGLGFTHNQASVLHRRSLHTAACKDACLHTVVQADHRSHLLDEITAIFTRMSMACIRDICSFCQSYLFV